MISSARFALLIHSYFPYTNYSPNYSTSGDRPFGNVETVMWGLVMWGQTLGNALAHWGQTLLVFSMHYNACIYVCKIGVTHVQNDR